MTTRLGLYGGPAQDYGAFDPKTEIIPEIPDKARTTRLGLYGGPRQLYGSFYPKAEQMYVAPIGHGSMLPMKNVRRSMRRGR